MELHREGSALQPAQQACFLGNGCPLRLTDTLMENKFFFLLDGKLDGVARLMISPSPAEILNVTSLTNVIGVIFSELGKFSSEHMFLVKNVMFVAILDPLE